jgi:hypothetical protein
MLIKCYHVSPKTLCQKKDNNKVILCFYHSFVNNQTTRPEDSNLSAEEAEVAPDFPEDYADYQSDAAGIHSDPQFPVYSNWQRADDEVGNFR